ncbi:MAG: NADH-quinone oxidoreductase subunit J [Candidatus Zixiibacteriota bacterium]
MTLDLATFLVSAVVAVLGATMMIAQRNPVASVLYMILSLVAQAVCYVQLGGLFLGAILVIVYAGAILVLFLFVIMLLNLRGSEDLGAPARPVGQFTKYIFGVLLTMELVFIVRAVPFSGTPAGIVQPTTSDFGSVKDVAMTMFTDYLYPFELTGVLLLVAVVGAVVIARKHQLAVREAGERPATGEEVEE